jgi:hypothetical protein
MSWIKNSKEYIKHFLQNINIDDHDTEFEEEE